MTPFPASPVSPGRVALARALLARNLELVRGLVAGRPEAEMRWKPDARRWSLLEVVAHLADEERDDFRRRLDLVLHAPGEPWPPIDPERWCVERAYNAREPAEALADFVAERERSLGWLAQLGEPALDVAAQHPSLGRMHAGDLLASWLAHDAAHLRQMLTLELEHLRVASAPFSIAYAGA